MAIFQFFYDMLANIYNAFNVDFFGFGFGFMDFTFGSLVVMALLKFVFQGFNSLSGDFTGSALSLARNAKISNDKRQKELVKEQEKKEGKK